MSSISRIRSDLNGPDRVSEFEGVTPVHDGQGEVWATPCTGMYLVMLFGFWTLTGSYQVGFGFGNRGITSWYQSFCYLVPGGARDLRLVDVLGLGVQ